MTQKTDPTLEPLRRLIGKWTTVATHPMMPGVVVHGSAECEWLEGERFLLMRSRTDHPQFPDALAVIGHIEHDRVDEHTGATSPDAAARPLRLHYYDSRGVYRDYESSIDETAWRFWRNAPGFSQRFTGTFADGGDTIVGLAQLCRDDVHWADDLEITYRRQANGDGARTPT